MLEQWRIHITGKVQGVWFRKHTQETALEFGIKGWVHNEPDGSVLVIAEGTPDQLELLTSWCRHGPPLAIVQEVQIIKGVVEGFNEFKIR